MSVDGETIVYVGLRISFLLRIDLLYRLFATCCQRFSGSFPSVAGHCRHKSCNSHQILHCFATTGEVGYQHFPGHVFLQIICIRMQNNVFLQKFLLHNLRRILPNSKKHNRQKMINFAMQSLLRAFYGKDNFIE